MDAFTTLNELNINGHTEKKSVGGKDLTYLSWPWAWAEVKKRFPDAHYTIWRNNNGNPYTFDPLTGYMVYTSVTIDGISHEMWLPVMDGANRAMKAEAYDYTVKNPNFKYAKWDNQRQGYFDKYGNSQPEYLTKHCEPATMMDINKTIMRCLVKNLAMFGLGLYIYAGEDLPEGEQDQKQVDKSAQNTADKPAELPPKTSAKAQVSISARVPEANPVAAYINREIATMRERYGNDFNFVAERAALIKAGTIENVPSKDMTMEQAVQMVEAIYKTVDMRAAS